MSAVLTWIDGKSDKGNYKKKKARSHDGFNVFGAAVTLCDGGILVAEHGSDGATDDVTAA